MVPAERVCLHCGWRNESDARMCGGCGQPLGTAGTPLHGQRRDDLSPFITAGSGGDAPTEYAPGVTYNPLEPTRAYDNRAAGTPPQPNAAPARWPASAQPSRPAYSTQARPAKRRGGSCLQRMLLALLALVVVVSCCGIGLWSFVLRPALHTATDTQIRTGLDSIFNDASNTLEQTLPLLPKGTYTDVVPVNAADINARLREAAGKKGIPAAEVHFVGTDGIQVTYQIGGKPHLATTHLYIEDGRLRARDTTDDFPLNMWESNAELETSINEALTHLTPDLHLTDIHMHGDAFHFSFTK